MVINEYERLNLERLVTYSIRYCKKYPKRVRCLPEHFHWLKVNIHYNVSTRQGEEYMIICRNFVFEEFMKQLRSEPEDQQAEFRQTLRKVMKLG